MKHDCISLDNNELLLVGFDYEEDYDLIFIELTSVEVAIPKSQSIDILAQLTDNQKEWIVGEVRDWIVNYQPQD